MAALTLSLVASPALALSLQGNYFILSADHPDAQGGIDGMTLSGPASLVNGTLVGGLPQYSGTPGPASGAITDVDGSNGILWWTDHTIVPTGSVAFEKSQADPFNLNIPNNFFPDGHGDNADGYRSVHWTGAFHVGAGGASLSLTADDDAWLFLNSNLVLDNGGVKAISVATTSTTNLPAGDYLVDLFFADRHQVQSGVVFNCEGCLDPVPEPATLLLFGTTLAGLGTVVRRRMKKHSGTPEA